MSFSACIYFSVFLCASSCGCIHMCVKRHICGCVCMRLKRQILWCVHMCLEKHIFGRVYICLERHIFGYNHMCLERHICVCNHMCLGSHICGCPHMYHRCLGKWDLKVLQGFIIVALLIHRMHFYQFKSKQLLLFSISFTQIKKITISSTAPSKKSCTS